MRILILFAMLLGLNAFGANHYIRQGASGSANGSNWADAWTSIPTDLTRGDTYFMADGDYAGYTFDDAESSADTITIVKATVAAHGTDAGWDYGYGDGVAKFTGSFFIRAGYLIIDGAIGGGPGSWKTGYGFEFSSDAGTNINYIDIASGVSNIIVRHVYFNQIGNTEVTISGAVAIYNAGDLYNSTFEYNYFDNLGKLPWLLRNGSANIFQLNYTGNVCGVSVADPGEHCEVIVIHDMDDVHFRWNYIADSPSSGGFVKNNTQTSDSIRIYGNVFKTGFPIQCNTGTCTNWRIFNNTFASVRGPFGGDGKKIGILYYNNILYGASSWSYAGLYSWISNSGAGQCDKGTLTAVNCTKRYPNNCDVCSEKIDPFVDSSGATPESYSLSYPITSWSGIDTCSLDSCVGEKKYNIDMFGKTRGFDGTWERGAIEYQSPTSTTSTKSRARLRIKP